MLEGQSGKHEVGSKKQRETKTMNQLMGSRNQEARSSDSGNQIAAGNGSKQHGEARVKREALNNGKLETGNKKQQEATTKTKPYKGEA